MEGSKWPAQSVSWGSAPGRQPTPQCTGVGVTKKGRAHTGGNNTSLTQRGQDQLPWRAWSSVANSSCLLPARGYVLVGPSGRGPVPPCRGDTTVALTQSHMTHTLRQNKGAHMESGTGKDIPTQGDKPNTGCEAPCLLVRKVPGTWLHLCGPTGVERLDA